MFTTDLGSRTAQHRKAGNGSKGLCAHHYRRLDHAVGRCRASSLRRMAMDLLSLARQLKLELTCISFTSSQKRDISV